jgi:hypothetical protein
LEFGSPKSEAGVRTVALPEAALQALRPHLAAHVASGPEALMQRMGHASMSAALIDQHATSDRDREIADGMERKITDYSGEKTGKGNRRKKKRDKGDDGSVGSLARVT